MSSDINMLTNSLKVSDTPKIEFFELFLFRNDKKLRQEYCHADLSKVLEPLICWLSIRVLRRGILRN